MRDAQWFAITEVPKLAFDHRQILVRAHARLIAKLGYSTIALQMMPPEFTLSELQEVYEIIRDQAKLPQIHSGAGCAVGHRK